MTLISRNKYINKEIKENNYKGANQIKNNASHIIIRRNKID